MSKINYVKQSKCPHCQSASLLTYGLDQICTECDWDNLKLLVDLGQLDNPQLAAFEHFRITYKTSRRNQRSKIIREDLLTT